MERRLGELAAPYREPGPARTPGRLAKAAVASGALLAGALGRRSRPAAFAAGVLLSAGAVLTRWSVYRAGAESAADARATTGPQRDRIASGDTAGSVRVVVQRP
jgi:hypothetical protein